MKSLGKPCTTMVLLLILKQVEITSALHHEKKIEFACHETFVIPSSIVAVMDYLAKQDSLTKPGYMHPTPSSRRF
jgi:hypothetical protein